MSLLHESADDMLKALQGLLDNYAYNNGKGLGIAPIMKARKAIEKATGKKFAKSDAPQVECWSDKRWEQLANLENLLRDCQSIDSANNITLRLQRIMDGADRLANSRIDADHYEPSFVHFLTSLAQHDHELRKAVVAKAEGTGQ